MTVAVGPIALVWLYNGPRHGLLAIAAALPGVVFVMLVATRRFEAHAQRVQRALSTVSSIDELAQLTKGESTAWSAEERLLRAATAATQAAAVARERETQANRRLAEAEAAIHGLLQRRVAYEEWALAELTSDLHDSVTQTILGALWALDAGDSERARDELHRAEQQLRAVMALTRPPTVTTTLAEALHLILEELHDLYGLTVTVTDWPNDAPDMVEEAAAACYRFLQEALRNVAKHACTNHATVAVTRQESRLALQVSDTGKGFDPASLPSCGRRHFGLASLRDRAAAVQGSLDISSAPRAGTTLTLTVPLASPAS